MLTNNASVLVTKSPAVLQSLPILQAPQIQRYTGSIKADLERFKTIKQADLVYGKFSSPSKMPGFGYGLPASKCKTGGSLRFVKGSVCYSCYAADDWNWAKQGGHHSNYPWKNVKSANQRRFDSLTDPMWVPAIVFTILKRKCKEFRWHDSGDLQSLNHFYNICKVCEHTPNTLHWLPTREYEVIDSVDFDIPDNLCVRVSAHIVGKQAPKRFKNTSVVVDDPTGHKNVCPVTIEKDRRNCEDCRNCWDKSIATIAYLRH